LNFEALRRFDHLSFREREMLELAAMGKRSLRRDLQNALNTPGTRIRIKPDDARTLIDRIADLNGILAEFEARIRAS